MSYRYAKVRADEDHQALSDSHNCCFRLCTGRTHWVISILCFLPVLIWNSMKIYLLPCLGVLFARCCSRFCCYFCRKFCPDCYMYKDKNFPPITKSLACADNKQEFRSSELKDLSLPQIKNKIKWIRASQLCKTGKMYLFEDGIEPSDVVQGALGDCWLMAALAALAEFPGAIENCFWSFEYSTRGKYYLKLYDARIDKRKKQLIVIDDFIPCFRDDNQPIFSQPKGSEMWVLLLEKAFAKFCGGYSELKGGHAMWAMQAITGDHVFRFQFDEENQCWTRWDIEYKMATSRNPKRDWVLKDSKQRFDHKRVWALIQEYDKNNSVIAASVTKNSNRGNRDSTEQKCEATQIVSGHTYSVLRVISVEGFDLLYLRNPWGDFEWNGDWSDNSDLWQKYPKIAKKLNFNNKEDGLFWIEYTDFIRLFNVIQICDRSSINNLHLNVNEDAGCCGVMKGCCVGCGYYWCCCRGLMEIYCGRTTSDDIIETKQVGSSWTVDIKGNVYVDGDDVKLEEYSRKGDKNNFGRRFKEGAKQGGKNFVGKMKEKFDPTIKSIMVRNEQPNYEVTVAITHKTGWKAFETVCAAIAMTPEGFGLIKDAKEVYHAAKKTQKVIKAIKAAKHGKEFGGKIKEIVENAFNGTLMFRIKPNEEKNVHHEKFFEVVSNPAKWIEGLFKKNIKDLKITFLATNEEELDPETYYRTIDTSPYGSDFLIKDWLIYHAKHNKDSGEFEIPDINNCVQFSIRHLDEKIYKEWPGFRYMEQHVEDIVDDEDKIQSILKSVDYAHEHAIMLCVVRYDHETLQTKSDITNFKTFIDYDPYVSGTEYCKTTNGWIDNKKDFEGSDDQYVYQYVFVLDTRKNVTNVTAKFELEFKNEFTISVTIANHENHNSLKVNTGKKNLVEVKNGEHALKRVYQKTNDDRFIFHGFVEAGRHNISFVEIEKTEN
eukprot:423645_1